MLLTTSVSPNARGLRHKNALHLASARGHCKVVEFLIMNGVRGVGCEGVRGRDVHVLSVIPLPLPISPFPAILPFLVHFPSPSIPPPCLPSLSFHPTSLPPLSLPPPLCSLSLPRALSASIPAFLSQANVNARGGSRQRTPLHYASLNNHVALATILLEVGANEFARDLGGYTPLNLCMGGDMCKLLHKVCVAMVTKCTAIDLTSYLHALAMR